MKFVFHNKRTSRVDSINSRYSKNSGEELNFSIENKSVSQYEIKPSKGTPIFSPQKISPSKQGSALFGKTSNKYEAYTDDEPDMPVFASQNITEFKPHSGGISFVQNEVCTTSVRVEEQESLEKSNEVTEVYMMSGSNSQKLNDIIIDAPVQKPKVKDAKRIKSSLKQSASLTPKSSIIPN